VSHICKIDRSVLGKEINKRLARGDSANNIIAWARTKEFDLSRPTIYTHKAAITDPKTAFVEEARSSNPTLKRVTPAEFLQTVVDVGALIAAEDPGSISINHALKAAGELEKRTNKQIDVLMFFAEKMQRRLEPPTELIEGEYKEIPLGIETVG
jgi:hypothetical protein